MVFQRSLASLCCGKWPVYPSGRSWLWLGPPRPAANTHWAWLWPHTADRWGWICKDVQRFMFVICLCGLRSWDLIFWDTVRTSRRSPAVGSAAGLPTWNICCISQTMGFCFNKAPPQMTAVWLQSTQLQVRYTSTAIIFTNCLFCNKFSRT